MSTTTAIDAPVTPEELAATLHAYAGPPDPISWEHLDDATRRRLVSQARDIAEDAASAVEDALADLHGDEHSNADASAVLDLIQRFDDDGLVDLIAGTSPIEEALRRARTEARR